MTPLYAEGPEPLPTWVPPGWYPDPLAAGAARYWDGSGWSKNYRDAPPPDPLPAQPHGGATEPSKTPARATVNEKPIARWRSNPNVWLYADRIEWKPWLGRAESAPLSGLKVSTQAIGSKIGGFGVDVGGVGVGSLGSKTTVMLTIVGPGVAITLDGKGRLVKALIKFGAQVQAQVAQVESGG